MIDQPKAADLLATAREVLLEELLPHLPKDARYPALMVANAMGISSRECADEEIGAALRALFESVYGEDLDDEAVQDEGGRLSALNARLAADIRRGALDDRAGSLLPALRRALTARLRVSNPKYLGRAGS